ncbi:MAG: acetyl-CoA carboxylase biotin carboxyl carrier protein [Candidatus Omnitrophica bacterium]|nr:acetyl-CoA carboxylase biotin carboxyl carrier protein [Candidatus Omnitrophota bacterium]
MDINELKEIINLMKVNKLTELEIEENGLKIKLKKSNGIKVSQNPGMTQHIPVAMQPVQPPPLQQQPAPEKDKTDEDDPTIAILRSPMVGTFYEGPAPNAKPFMILGQKVKVDDTLCIVEAMKLMNEIKCEVAGEIVEILIKNGQSVEFDQPLFKIKQA